MKKNLLTLMFVIAFICVGVTVASAKNTSSSANSSSVSKKLSVAKGKIKSLKANCKGLQLCDSILNDVILWNGIYNFWCAPDYLSSCAPWVADTLIDLGNAWASCMNLSKNTDKTIDRNKTEKFRNVALR